MKKLLIVLVLCLGAFLGGCGLVDSSSDRGRRYDQINKMQWRMAVDDWDYFWLYERNTYLTEYHPHVGL